MDTIDDDLSAKAGVLWFQITFETSASCDSEVLLQSSNILTAYMVDVSVFAGVSSSMKQVKSSLVTLKSNRSSSF